MKMIGKGRESWEELVKRSMDGQLSPQAAGLIYMISLLFLQRLWPSSIDETEVLEWCRVRAKCSDAAVMRGVQELIDEGYLVVSSATREARV